MEFPSFCTDRQGPWKIQTSETLALLVTSVPRALTTLSQEQEPHIEEHLILLFQSGDVRRGKVWAASAYICPSLTEDREEQPNLVIVTMPQAICVSKLMREFNYTGYKSTN